MTAIPPIPVEIEYCFDTEIKRWIFKVSAGGYCLKLLPFVCGQVPVVALASAISKLSTTIEKDKKYNEKYKDTNTKLSNGRSNPPGRIRNELS
jgi:hypothetical protein